MYGMGNWVEIGDHVGTKSKEVCIEHYKSAYMNSPCFPLPDMTHVVGKNRKELLAMAKGHGEDKKGSLEHCGGGGGAGKCCYYNVLHVTCILSDLKMWTKDWNTGLTSFQHHAVRPL